TSRLRTPFDIVPALLQSNDLLQGPDRQPLVDDPLRQAILEVAVLQRKQCPRVPRTQYPRRYARLHLGWEVEQPQCVGDVRTRTPQPLSQLTVRGTEVVQQLLVSRSLLQGVELLALQVLQESVPEQLIVLGTTDDRGDPVETGLLGRPPPALPHDQFMARGTIHVLEFADHDRLQKTDLDDRVPQLLQGLLVEVHPRLPRVRRDRVELDLFQVGSVRQTGRYVLFLHGPVPFGGRLSYALRRRGGHRPLRDERPQPLAQSAPLLAHRLLPPESSSKPHTPPGRPGVERSGSDMDALGTERYLPSSLQVGNRTGRRRVVGHHRLAVAGR